MQTILENKDERSHYGGTDSMNSVICIGRISRCMEGKCIKRFGGRRSGIWVSRGIFVRTEKRVWRRRRGVSKDDGTKKDRARRKDYGEVCAEVQKSSKRKQL